MLQAKLSDILRSPSSLLAIIGLALITLGREAHRYPVLASVENIGFLGLTIGHVRIPVSTLITLAALLIFYLIMRASGGRSRAFSFGPALVVALVMSAGYLGKFDLFAGSAIMPFLRACSEFTQACGFFIMISWAVLLYRNERDRLLILVAYSFLLSGIVQALLAITLPEVGIVLCTFTPVFSVLVLRIYRFTHENDTRTLPSMNFSSDELAAAPTQQSAKPVLSKTALFALVCVVCYGIICYIQSLTWLSTQQYRLAPLLVQSFSALGSILAAVVLIVLVQRDFNVMNGLVYKVFIFAIFAASIFVSSFAQSHGAVGVFTTFVDAGYKFILLFIWLYPLFSRTKWPELTAFTGLHATYFLGVFIGTVIIAFPTFEFAVLILALVVLIIDIVLSMMRVLNQSRTTVAKVSDTGDANAAKDAEGAEEAGPESDADEEAAATGERDAAAMLETYKRMLFMVYISQTYQLTQREVEVLPYFLRSMNTKDIAQTLYISQETVRTHRRNIYKKLEVSGREELQQKVQTLEEQNFPAFLQSVASSTKAME